MADQEWLKNLARARFVNGSWQHEEPAQIRELTAERMRMAADDLFELAADYAEAFNDLAKGRRQIRALRSANGGLLLLLGRSQMALTPEVAALAITLTVVRGYERATYPLYRLEPIADAFGMIVWRIGNAVDNTLIMTGELIIKRLLQDLTRAACEVGDIPGGT